MSVQCVTPAPTLPEEMMTPPMDRSIRKPLSSLELLYQATWIAEEDVGAAVRPKGPLGTLSITRDSS